MLLLNYVAKVQLWLVQVLTYKGNQRGLCRASSADGGIFPSVVLSEVISKGIVKTDQDVLAHHEP